MMDNDYRLSGVETLIADHSSQQDYFISLDRLKFLQEMGVENIKIHRIVRIPQRPFLADFINGNIELRNLASTLLEKKWNKENVEQHFW